MVASDELLIEELVNYIQDYLIEKRSSWVQNNFVSDIGNYQYSNEVDGNSPFEWRQGIKHDCSSIMELDRVNGYFVNGLQQEIVLEEDLVYGVLKSSDLKQTVIDKTRKFTIITQNHYIQVIY